MLSNYTNDYINFLESAFDPELWATKKRMKQRVLHGAAFRPDLPWLPTEESLFSVTPHDHARYITEVLSSIHDPEDCIFDACAGLGGNTIEFARYFDTVVACEPNKVHYSALKHNVTLCGLKDKVELHNSSAFDVDVDVKVLFLDPPWGPSEYGFSLEGNIVDLTNELQDDYDFETIVLKLPHAFPSPSAKSFGLAHQHELVLYSKVKLPIYKYVVYTNKKGLKVPANRIFRPAGYSRFKVLYKKK